MRLQIQNNLTKKVYTFDNLDDKLTSRLFYTFDLTLPSGMDDGIYQYKLFDGDTVKATGLLQVGEFTAKNNTYSAQTQNGYIQYNAN